mgnify:CR=1 FL=1
MPNSTRMHHQNRNPTKKFLILKKERNCRCQKYNLVDPEFFKIQVLSYDVIMIIKLNFSRCNYLDMNLLNIAVILRGHRDRYFEVSNLALW